MSAHTPGPWVVFDGASPGIDARGIASIVLFGGPDEHDLGVQGRTKEEAQANARLIAAAPELLEALRHAVAAKDAELAGFRKNLGRDPLVMPAWLDPARAAIAKAEGA